MLLVAALATPALAAAPHQGKHGGNSLSATLTGAAERPGPGDPDGSGTAALTLNHGQRTICWKLTYQNIAAPSAAHIHKAPPSEAGGVVLPLSPISEGCATASRAFIKELRKNPGAYYVNIHNGDDPGGAIRGQLSRG